MIARGYTVKQLCFWGGGLLIILSCGVVGLAHPLSELFVDSKLVAGSGGRIFPGGQCGISVQYGNQLFSGGSQWDGSSRTQHALHGTVLLNHSDSVGLSALLCRAKWDMGCCFV